MVADDKQNSAKISLLQKIGIRLKMRHLNNTFCLSFSMLFSALSSPPLSAPLSTSPSR